MNQIREEETSIGSQGDLGTLPNVPIGVVNPGDSIMPVNILKLAYHRFKNKSKQNKRDYKNKEQETK